MKSDIVRYMHLEDELDASVKLIKSGFGFLQEIDFANEFYHLPHQLLASGLERFLKSYISAVIHDRTKAYPDINGMKKIGHDLCELRTKIMEKYFTGLLRPLIRTEQHFVLNDKTLGDCLRVLSDFGKKGRYYNLDIVAGSDESPIDPKEGWELIERSILNPIPYLADVEAMQRDYFPRVNQVIIARLERFLRAISLQFTLGDDSTVGSKVRKLSVFVTDFSCMNDAEFGTKDYRKRTKVKPANWKKRSDQEILTGGSPTKIMDRDNHKGIEWPFRQNRVIVELRERLFAIVHIEGYAFSLNGLAASRFGLPSPHETGAAILGKSIGPFIDAANGLGQ